MIKFAPSNIKSMVTVVKAGLVKHSPEILMGAGAVSFIVTVITASKATIKAQDILEDHKKKLDDIKEIIDYCEKYPDSVEYCLEDSKKDKTVAYVQTGLALAKDYAPAVGFAAISLTCFFGAFGIMKKRYTTIAMAYSALEQSFRKYRERVIADKGEEADLYYMTGQKPKEVTVKSEDGKKQKVTQLVLPDGTIASPYAFKFGKYKENGELNKQWQNDINLLRAYCLGQQDYLNDQLYLRCVFDNDHNVLYRGAVMLNEIRDIFGEDPTPTGAVVGNRFSNGEEGCNGYIDLKMTEAVEEIEEDGEIHQYPCMFFNPNVDGLIYDLLNKKEPIPFAPVYGIYGED